MDAKSLPVSVGLPAGYLSVQPFGLGKGVSNLFFSNTVNYYIDILI